ncbi:MAG: UDP binding domain-containing protein, partial [Methylocella sp.]
PGVGGHCIAVDPWFIVNSAPDLAKLIATARKTNDDMINYTIEGASALIDEHRYANIACLGLAFKPNVNDLRESPAVEVTKALGERSGRDRGNRRRVRRPSECSRQL